MTELPNKRENDRAAKRASMKEGVRPWPIGLSTNKSALRNLADLEWNFENFYIKVKRYAPSVTREELKEFMKQEDVKLKVRPKPKGRLI